MVAFAIRADAEPIQSELAGLTRWEEICGEERLREYAFHVNCLLDLSRKSPRAGLLRFGVYWLDHL